MSTVIVSVILIGTVVLVIKAMYKNSKTHKHGCSGNCGQCSRCH